MTFKETSQHIHGTLNEISGYECQPFRPIHFERCYNGR